MNRRSVHWAALVCIAVTTAFIIYMSVRLTDDLSTQDWCVRAMGAAQDTRPEYAVGGCFTLMQQQVAALALNSHIFAGVIALCLGALVVVVLAGARVAGHVGKDGLELNLSRDAGEAAVLAAKKVADAGDKAKDEVVAEAAKPDDPDGGKP